MSLHIAFTGPAQDRLAALLPKGQLRQVDDAYVLVMLDQPEQTAAEITKFLVSG